jgi:TM2 domain-containing membrane protein YozV
MTEEFLVSWKGQTLGPFTREEVQSRLLSGEFTPLHAIRRDGELIDASRWLHSLRASKSPTVPTFADEPLAPPPPPPPVFQNPAPPPAFPVSMPVEEIPRIPAVSPITPEPANLPPPPPPPVEHPRSSSLPPPPPPQQFPVSNSKSRVAFILLGVFLGGLGIHNFYAGYTSKALTQLLLNLFLFWTLVVPLGIWIWVLVEVISINQDAQGRPFA